VACFILIQNNENKCYGVSGALVAGTMGLVLPVSIFGFSGAASFFLLPQPAANVSENATASITRNSDFDLVGFIIS
jgi:hypothetical protein